MRNAIDIGNGFIITTDNSGGIGEKPSDLVAVSDRLTAYFAARVALLEQWASHAEPVTILIHNFSGSASWENYVAGVTDLFHEAGLEIPQISGSSETNMELMQSAMAVTMIGRVTESSSVEESSWFTYGTPLVGNEVLDRADEIASLRLLKEAIDKGIVQRIWPVGSQGILQEVRSMTGNREAMVESVLDTTKTAGPSTVVLLAIFESKTEEAKAFFGIHLNQLNSVT
jgi:hypothetical protein